MPTNRFETKGIEYSTTHVLVSADNATIAEAHEELAVTAVRPRETDITAIDVELRQKLPEFYQHKIRVRKYDFL